MKNKLYTCLERAEEAMKIFDDVVKHHQSHGNVWLLAEIYAELGEYEKSLYGLFEFEKSDPFSINFELIQHYHIFESLYGSPEFIDLIDRVKKRKEAARKQIEYLENTGHDLYI